MQSRRFALSLSLLLTIAVLGGCTASPDTTGPLPRARPLLDASADALAQLRSVNFAFSVSGAVPGLSVREIDGVARRDPQPHGYAHGAADVQRGTKRAQYEFVVADGTLTLEDGEGRTMREPVPQPFDPAQLLDPTNGLRTLLDGARQARTEGKEELHDVPTFRVDGRLPRHVISAVIPGVHTDVDVKFWVSQDQSRRLLRMWVQVPPRQRNEGAVMLELALTNHNAGVEPQSSAAG
ncbi:lipoprotein LprG [Saccharomonospora amisosensis]|uniref:Lipoprotein LprG n=1 Tax=Saccharomonospora amisosensis TaxID=1128677 RepID=A0A7X5UUD9_9PSEU|nr:LppX_LprAFG lipoprotein [Saccharomonospora amisosensis]NIJ13874.1 lipoprotein LprG [Saccharomonospora amisosensis]